MDLNSILSFFNHNIILLVLGLVMDSLIGDPKYKWHPIRLIGQCLSGIEKFLFKNDLNTKFGGVLLFLTLAFLVLGLYHLFIVVGVSFHPVLKWMIEIYVVTHLVALKDLLLHVRRIAEAVRQSDLKEARFHASMLVGRDIDKMDLKACNRSAIESVSESLVDGVISPLFFLLFGGVYGILLFKVVSTMDSMVGYKNQKYLKFGWCGARLDDLLNWVPARLTWLLMCLTSQILPGFSGKGCFKVGLQQHAIIPGPNAGWSECGMAGGLGIRIAGPIYKNGKQVNDKWLGEENSPEGGSVQDVFNSITLTVVTTFLFLLLSVSSGIFLNNFAN